MRIVVFLTVLGLTGCASSLRTAEPGPLPDGAFVRVLGIAQDAGVPHTACYGDCCSAARIDPGRAHLVSCLGLVVPREEGHDTYLFDATPDLTEQLVLLRDVRRPPSGRTDRRPVSGIFLTHAHLGHYLGLAWLGFESIHAQGVPVHATPRMAGFLRENGPWSQLVALQNIDLHELPVGAPLPLPGGIRVTAHPVPHRDEFSDTVAFRIAGPNRTILFMPDTEPWERWSDRFDALLEGVDVLLVDGTFFSADELPGRRVSSIGHPLMVDTIARLGPRVAAGELQVTFIHLNHSNPALDPGSEARATIQEAGFGVAREGAEYRL